MVLWSSPSSSAVIKLQSQLLLETMSTGLCTCQSEIYTTMFVEHIGMGLFFSGFYPSPKVRNLLNRLNNFSVLIMLVLGHKKYANDGQFHCFRRQLFHTSLARILESLKDSMTTPEVIKCLDGHYCYAIYTFGPYIGDYPEQVLLTNIIQLWCLKYVFFFFRYALLFILFNRCLVPRDDLDCPDQSYHCREHTNILLNAWPTLKLWDEYGIVNNIQVSFVSYLYPFNWQISVFHHTFSPSGYIQNDNSWSPPSGDQGGIQGPCRWVGPTMAGPHHGKAQANRILENIDQW